VSTSDKAVNWSTGQLVKVAVNSGQILVKYSNMVKEEGFNCKYW